MAVSDILVCMCMLPCFHIHPVRSSCPGGWDCSAQKNRGCMCSTQSKQVPRSPPGRAECTDCCLVAQSVPRIDQSQRPLLRCAEQFLQLGVSSKNHNLSLAAAATYIVAAKQLVHIANCTLALSGLYSRPLLLHTGPLAVTARNGIL